MDIQYLSNAEAAQFGAMIHSGSELAELFGVMVVLLDVDTDYDTILISFENENVLRVSIEGSPYLIILDENAQVIILEQNEENIFEDNFDEDGVESVVDIIASRILGEEYNAR